VFAETQLSHLVIRHFDSSLIVLGDQTGVDRESGGGGRQGQARRLGQWEHLDLSPPRQPLFLLTGTIAGAIEPATLQGVTAEAMPLDQGTQGIFDGHVDGARINLVGLLS